MAWRVIDGNTSWQDLAVAQEIATAYNLRVAALGSLAREAASVEEISPTEEMTVYGFVDRVQRGIERMAIFWADSTAALSGGYDYPATFESKNALLQAAGLTQSGGWRRIPEGGVQPEGWASYTAPGWSYGRMVDKDLAGPWLFIDLQVALIVMRRRLYTINDGAGGYSDIVVTHKERQLGEGEEFSLDVQPSTSRDFEQSIEADNYSALGLIVASKYSEKRADEAPPYNLQTWYGLAWGAQSYWNNTTVIGLGAVEKDIYVLGEAYIDFGADFNIPEWSTSLGTAWGFGDFGVGEARVNVFKTKLNDTTGEIDFSTPPQMASEWSSWAAIFAYIPWPELPTVAQKNEYNLVFNTMTYMVAVDYHFDP